MDLSLAQKIIAQIGAAKHPAILAHLRPDGDAFGSILGLAHTLREWGAQPQVFVEGGIISMYQFLPGSELVQDLPASLPSNTDCFIALDTSTRERLGQKTISWSRPVDIVIDHHISNPGYGKHNLIIADIPSTTGVLFELFQIAKWKITPAAATCLFTGLTTDTGSFRYSNANREAFTVAGEMIECGVNAWDVAEQLYENQPRRRLEMLALCLPTLEVIMGGLVASLTVTLDMYSATGADSELTDGFVNYPRSIRGVEVAIFFRQLEEKKFKIGFRSKGKINVAAFSAAMGGGGHHNAAGCTIEGTVDEVKSKVYSIVESCL
ncbi:MAG: bifunctional oligoribonuclease/PAP phosphatase NrnA [Verrucomicrobiota bacterium]